VRFASFGIVVLLVLIGGCSTAGRDVGRPHAGGRPSKIETDAPVNPEIQRSYNKALTALRDGRLKEAEALFKAITAKAPDLSGPYANLGLLYRRVGRNTESIAALERAIEINPRRAVYYNELGIVYRQEGKFDLARRNYRKAIETDNQYAPAHLNLAILLDLYLQEPKEALPYYQRYRDLVPTEAATVKKWIIDLERRTGQKPSKGKRP